MCLYLMFIPRRSNRFIMKVRFQEMLLRMRQIPRPVERKSSLSPGERKRNFCTMVYFWKNEMKVWKKK